MAVAAAPAYAASPSCNRVVPFDSSWGPIVDIVGSHTQSSAPFTYRSTTGDLAQSGTWRSHMDLNWYAPTGIDPAKLNASYSITYILDVTAGIPLNFSTSISLGFANGLPTTSLEQRVTFTLGGQYMSSYTSRPEPYALSQYYPDNSGSVGGWTGGTTRADGFTILAAGNNAVSWQVTPTTTGLIPLTLTFWRAFNLRPDSQRLSNVNPYDSLKTNNSGSDKLIISPLNINCVLS